MRLRPRFRMLVAVAVVSLCIVMYTATTTTSKQPPYIDPHQHHHYGSPAHISVDEFLALTRSEVSDGVLLPPAALPLQQHTSRSSSLPMLPATSPCSPPCKVVLSRNNTWQKHDSSCGRACRQAILRKNGRLLSKSTYGNRVQVENVTLPSSWTVSKEVVDRLAQRQKHVQETCRKHGMDKPMPDYEPNAWEFLINKAHRLIWCNVFKAASSTWFYNFNLLAGYSESLLLHTKTSPVDLARRKYKRPSVEELQQALNSSEAPLTFMIVRHPFKRLVSGYRDKIESGNRYYSRLSQTVVKTYWHLLPASERKKWHKPGMRMVARFPQFVQFIIDETAKGHPLDEHWAPMNTFCTPCLVPFDVFAKVETLQEDGNYIIFQAGIQDVIKPKLINRSRNGPTEEVADKFLCQLTKDQMEGLIDVYKMDLELFQYDVSMYQQCVQDSKGTSLTNVKASS